MFRVFYENGTEVKEGDVLVNDRNPDIPWIYVSTTHPRKIYVMWKNDQEGDDFYPNVEKQEYYANVFDLGIWDDNRKEWTFEPKTPFTPNL